MTLQERLRGYNPPDRTIDSQRQIAVDIHEAADALDVLQRDLAAAQSELASAKAERDKLVMAVAKKYPGETRYQTALRYINQAEAQGNDAGECAAHPKDAP